MVKSESSTFHVVIHDVTPQLCAPLDAVVRQLQPLVGQNISAAIVPCWHGEPLTRLISSDPSGLPDATRFVDWVKSEFDEILLHGYTHCRIGNGGPVGLLTRKANEFTGISAAVAMERLRSGQAIITECFGEPAAGFVPPAWQWGPITPEILRECGFRYGVGLAGIYHTDGSRIPLATWSWDAGVFAPLGYAGEALGAAMFKLKKEATPCIVLHPLDIERGFVKRGARVVERLLAEGKRPAMFCERQDRGTG